MNPGIQATAEHLRAGLVALPSYDAVLGPAADGGYYLIGMRRFLPELFRGIQWGGEQVLEQTLVPLLVFDPRFSECPRCFTRKGKKGGLEEKHEKTQ